MFYLLLYISEYSTGMKMRMMIVPAANPPMMVTASDPKRESEMRGIIPRMVVSEAIITGSRRDLLLSMSALSSGLPWDICSDISSMSTIPFLIIIPISPSMPTMATNPKSFPERSTDGKTPTTTNGMQEKMMAGRLKSLNSMMSMSSIITTDSGKPLKRYCLDWVLALYSPSHESEYPSGRAIDSMALAIDWRADSVDTPGAGEHWSLC